MKTTKILSAVIAAMALLLTSCFNNDEPNNGADVFMTFVTVASVNDSYIGFDTSVFQGSKTISYTTLAQKNVEFKVGDRYLISFTTENNDASISGPINLTGMAKLNAPEMEVAPMSTIEPMLEYEPDCTWRSAGLGYLNIRVSGDFTGFDVFKAMVDEATIDQDYPEVYIAFKPKGISGGQSYSAIDSFNMKPLLDRPDCRGLKLHFWMSGIEYTQLIYFNGEEPSKPEQAH